MPTYQYACKQCDHRFEAVQSFSDASLSECPQCAGQLRKLFGSVGVIFKGSGFYRNDSRSGSGKTATETAPAASSASSDSSKASSDSSTKSSSDKPSSNGTSSTPSTAKAPAAKAS